MNSSYDSSQKKYKQYIFAAKHGHGFQTRSLFWLLTEQADSIVHIITLSDMKWFNRFQIVHMCICVS